MNKPSPTIELMADSLKNSGEKVVESPGACELVWTRDGFTKWQIHAFGNKAREVARYRMTLKRGEVLL